MRLQGRMSAANSSSSRPPTREARAFTPIRMPFPHPAATTIPTSTSGSTTAPEPRPVVWRSTILPRAPFRLESSMLTVALPIKSRTGSPLGTTPANSRSPRGPLQGVAYAASNSTYSNGLNNWKFFQFDVVDAAGNSGVENANFFVQLDGAGTAINAWHSWRDFGRFINAADGLPADSWRIDGDDHYTLGYPGSMDNAICVASYVTRTQWVDLDGMPQTQSGAVLGEISSFSSIGPRVDNLQKPDIAAPGEALVSTLASNLTQRPRSSIERDGVHQKMQGTSMAAPVVAGLAALMLQKNPNLNIQEARDYIRNNARDAGPTGWDPVWGAGKLDCPAVINAMGGTNPTPVPTSTTPPNQPTSTPTVPPVQTPTPTTGPAPEELVVNSSDTPMVIPTDWSTLSSTISVGSYHAAQVTVRVNLTHSDLENVITTLQSPDGDWVYLFNTEQAIPITPPQDVQGAWVLQILDFSGLGGVLNGWSLTFSGSGGTTGGTIACGQTVNGNIELTDEDYGDGTKFDTYTFSLPSQAQVTVQMYSDWFQSYFEVFEGLPGNPIGDMRFSGTADNIAMQASTTELLGAGDYFIKANHIDTVFYYPAPYQLTLDCGGVEFPTATPTSVPATNTPVPTDTPVSVATATATPVPVSSPTPMTTRSADLNDDGHVNDTDALILLDQWHRGPND